MVKIEDLPSWDEMDVITACIVGEAGSESLLGKLAVACVIRNRVEDKRWPSTYKEVILQPHQFSCFSPRYYRPEIMKHDWGDVMWRECKFAAYGVYSNFVRDLTYGANHYFANYIDPPIWTKGKYPVLKVEPHWFYKL